MIKAAAVSAVAFIRYNIEDFNEDMTRHTPLPLFDVSSASCS